MDNHPVSSKFEFESSRVPEIGQQTSGNHRVPSAFAQDVEDIMSELSFLLISKHQDYGPKNIADAPGGAINGLLVRMHDKMARLKNLHYNNKSANYESIEDTYKDLANYAVIALMVLRDKWDK